MRSRPRAVTERNIIRDITIRTYTRFQSPLPFSISIIYGHGKQQARGSHSHRRRVQSCDRGLDAVKRSRHFLGVGQTVKQFAGHYQRHYWRSRGVADPFAHAQLIDGQGSRGKNPAWSSGQGRFSTVKNFDPGRSSGHGAYGSDPPPPPPPPEQGNLKGYIEHQ